MSDKRNSEQGFASYYQINPESRHEWFSISTPCWQKLLATHAETMGEALDLLSERDRTIVLVQLLIDEVDNGGLDQWLYSESGDRADEALQALKRIGSTKTYDWAAKAISLFPAEALPRDRNRRMEVMVEFEEKHPHVEDERFELSGHFHTTGENIIDLAIAYWRRTEPRRSPESATGGPPRAQDSDEKKTTP